MTQMYSAIFNDAISFPSLLKEITKFEKTSHNYSKTIRVAVIGSSSIQYFVKVLRFVLALKGYKAEIFESDYDGISMTLLSENEELKKFAPQYVIVLPYHLDIKQYPSVNSTEEEYRTLLQNTSQKYGKIWSNLEKYENVQVLFCNFVVPYIEELGSFECNTQNSKSEFLRALNREIMRTKPKFVTVIDLDAYASMVGKKNWFDLSGYFSTKIGFSLQYILPVVNKIVRLIDVLNGHIKKCLVLDLDNTLWGDVVGDVGTMGVILDPNDPEGESYRYFQSYVKALMERGVILAVCSKNDEKIAKGVFRDNPNMVLKLGDIACFMANWDDKATNIVKIAKYLNIGIDSLVFFDDNPAEREIVRRTLPEVSVIEVPENPDGYVDALYSSGVFDVLSITTEDISRSNTYIANSMRKELKETFVDYDAYLQALEMEVQIKEVDDTLKARFSQLINKSNQFNLRTQRYNEKQIGEMMADDDCCLKAVFLKDKFSYYGNIACVILKKRNGSELFVDTLVMSCRVLKRGIENLIMDAIVSQAKAMDCDTVTGEYLRTDRNNMVSQFFDSYGFAVEYKDENRTAYRMRTDAYVPCNDTRIKQNRNPNI